MRIKKYTPKHAKKKSAKPVKRIWPVLLSIILLIAAVTPAFAAGTSSHKEEVIYVNLAADGSVRNVYAVNIFGKGDITDYGEYSSVEMLNTKDKITLSGDRISFSSSADRVYYKGKMKSTDIPWNISIRYFVNGTEHSADEAAGKSGKLEIKFKVTKNEAYDGDFFDTYALQASFALDTKKCSNIEATDATLANVGSKKQISYTLLPGEGVDTIITADVKDFEMDAVSINGVPLSMSIEVDDEELMNQVTELLDAIAELNDGAGDLKDGVSDLQDATKNDLQSGVNELVDGVTELSDGAADLREGGAAMQDGNKELNDGAFELYDGVKSLYDGIALVQYGLAELNEKSSDLTNGSAEIKKALFTIQKELSAVSASTEQIDLLVSGSSQIKAGIDSLSEGVTDLQNKVSFAAYKAAMNQNGLNIDDLQTANTQTIETLSAQITTINEQIAYLVQAGGEQAQIAQLEASAEQLQGIVTLLQGNSAAIRGVDAYLTQTNASIAELARGIGNLKENYAMLDAGINELANQVKGLLVDMTELKAVIDALVTEYGKLDSGITEYTGGVAQIVAGYAEIVIGSGELLTGSSDLKSGTAELYSKTGELLNGIVKFYEATGTLKDGTGELADGVADLLEGIKELYDGTAELKDGTAEMRKETDGMDKEISEKIDEMIESITGGSSKVVSFVSEKNTSVEAVQFVIQTETVEIDDAETIAPIVKEELTFWQKILRLFGLLLISDNLYMR
ncbi:MAG: hypothetical protein ACI4GZ_02395 [Ruminococcus sp.]